MTLLLVLACSPPVAPTPKSPAGSLLWVSEQSGSPLTVRSDADAGQATPVLKLPGGVFPGPVDPKRTHALLVHSTGEGPNHLETLLLVPLKGGEPVQLGPAATAVRNPTWSPDGSWIVYESSAESFRDLYRVDRLGRVPQRLTNTEHGSFDPDVRGDGRIVFASSRSGDAELYSMASDGTDLRRLTTERGGDSHPRWTPDGKRITWLARRGPDVHVWQMDADGTHAAPFRFHPPRREIDQDFVWSPDGSLLCVTVQTGPKTIVLDLLSPDGKRHRRLQPLGVSEHATWSPDGRWLLFDTSPADTHPELYRVDVTQTDSPLVRLTTNTHADWLPRWIGP